MTKMINSNNVLLLIWKNPNTRQNYIVGQLEKGEKYTFKYSQDVDHVIKEGFKPLIGFENLSKQYTSDILFPVFTSRLPDRKRRDISTILAKYHIDEYDEFLLLKNGGARLPIDTIEFAPALGQAPFDIDFYVAGTRHYLGCRGDGSNNSQLCGKVTSDLNVDDKLLLLPEPDNIHDKNAIKLVAEGDRLIGYVPRYYCERVLDALADNEFQVSCCIKEISGQLPCENCIRARLKAEANQ